MFLDMLKATIYIIRAWKQKRILISSIFNVAGFIVLTNNFLKEAAKLCKKSKKGKKSFSI